VLYQFVIEGNLAGQPRLTTSKSGHPVCVVRILRNSRYRNAKGECFLGVGASSGLRRGALLQVRRQ